MGELRRRKIRACVDFLTIQALDGLDPLLPLSIGRAEQHGLRILIREPSTYIHWL